MPAWLMVLFRLTGIFVFAPLLSSRAIPARVKVFLALGLSCCVFPMLLSAGKASAPLIAAWVKPSATLWTLGPAVAAELLIGVVIGYAATLPLLGMQMGGRVVAQQMGLGLAEVFNPGEEQSGIVSHFFYLLGLSLFMILGGHRTLLAVLVGSFDHVPLGGGAASFGVLDLILGMLETAYELALRVAAPLLCLIFLETLAMGFIARTVPQLNILSIGFALRVVLGASILIGAVAIVSGVFMDVLRQSLQQVAAMFGL